MRLLTSLMGTKKLSISGNFNYTPEIWQAISAAVRNMPDLEEVFLCHHCPGMAQGPVCEVLNQARSLKYLTITEIIDTSVLDISGVSKRRHPSLNRLLVEDSRCGIQDLKRLISWPCRLEHLLLVPAGEVENSHVPWGLEELGPVLESQKTTLRTLGIWPLDLQGLRGFDLTEFESLEELDLSYFSTGCEPGTEVNLLAPKLRKFTWAFVFEAGWKCQMTCFEEAQESWLRGFATGALARPLPLGCIHLSFVPEGYLPDFSVPRPKISPWDRVEHLRDEFHHLGITLTCSATREDYERLWTPVRRPEEQGPRLQRSRPPSPDFHYFDPREDGSDSGAESVVRPDSGATQSNTILNYFARI
ncbi:hypothetical protein SAPIO_CDS6531 [Scedosporium apiospermum]|uniref:F-box domain-containing protein n=1 Tax=Pseudallescheria apiosperma TaxID=563466 RepID=A0A084G3P6_PSEDA|nr:uncharacterized protein SAPIO_CDS6531 [Scedosporium apiospermum]KEZ41958.1 hypothetical protein SAPIO_CDS6531 [Scedosporium apiospermum]